MSRIAAFSTPASESHSRSKEQCSTRLSLGSSLAAAIVRSRHAVSREGTLELPFLVGLARGAATGVLSAPLAPLRLRPSARLGVGPIAAFNTPHHTLRVTSIHRALPSRRALTNALTLLRFGIGGMYAQITRGGLRRANCAAHPPVSRSVSYLLISRSHPALTPPPALNPAPPLPFNHKYRVLAPAHTEHTGAGAMNKCARAERGTRVCEIPQNPCKVHLSGNYRVREIPSGPGRPRAPRVRRDAPAPDSPPALSRSVNT